MSVTQTEWIDLTAAAQIIAPGSIVVEEYQKEITDSLRRNSVLDGRLHYTPATGDFSSYFEQTEVQGGDFVDPRNPTATPKSNERSPRSAKVKAMTNATNFGHYDITLGNQQGNYTELQAKDINDMINGIGLTHGKGLWRGNDTALANPTTRQYVGIQKQITNTFSIGTGASIVAGIRAKVAAMVGSEKYELRPTAVYIDPIGHYYLEEEVRVSEENNVKVSGLSKSVIAGIEVMSILTAAGYLPIIPEPFILSEVNDTDSEMTDYGIVIVTEPMIEYHYVGKKDAYLFQLGTTADLQMKFVAIKYGCPIAKGASYAHAAGKITRPTIGKVG